jgi:hypothetical protein
MSEDVSAILDCRAFSNILIEVESWELGVSSSFTFNADSPRKRKFTYWKFQSK